MKTGSLCWASNAPSIILRPFILYYTLICVSGIEMKISSAYEDEGREEYQDRIINS
jgi:hypothetical protein